MKKKLPDKVDLRHLVGPIQDQGGLNSDASFAVLECFDKCFHDERIDPCPRCGQEMTDGKCPNVHPPPLGC